MLPDDYHDRVYAVLAGQVHRRAAGRAGGELDRRLRSRATLGEVSAFLPLAPGKLFQPDDDTAFPLLLIRALEQYGPDVVLSRSARPP